ncbi:peptidyl-prolyl cis-trans isomerase CYP95-like [Forsythia ovata]|uniref:Peptidyl-prolyl cis-trans isomerase CYP95-like n=1 Tax=Forsythia ovata TaxID=205694 RepID=A0ABD1RNH7_9LAMI
MEVVWGSEVYGNDNSQRIQFSAVLDLEISDGAGAVHVLDSRKLRVMGCNSAIILLVASSSFDGPITQLVDSNRDPKFSSLSVMDSIKRFSYADLYACYVDGYQALFADVAPKTAENFRALCTGERGVSPKSRKLLHYKGTFFHHIVKGSVAQGGDLLLKDGKDGECISDGKFPDESPKLKHDRPGLLSMGIAEQDGRGSLFSITLKADHRLDRKCVVFGELVDGDDMLKRIENAGNEEGKPTVTVKIVNSGEVKDDKKKGNKLKLGKDTVEANNHEERPKGKHRKSSKKGRKRRRYYTSESDSSSDTDSSESYSDFDSDASSLRDTNSSSDDRRKKRKRSKKDGDRHRKRKDKRCKWSDKKAKHRSKRDSLSNRENNSKSGSSSDDNDAEVRRLDEKHKNPGHHKIREVAVISEREEGEFPRENGERQINGVKVEMGPDKSSNRLTHVVEEIPRKSRSRSAGRSPSVGANHRRSRSPIVSTSAHRVSEGSRSSSPDRRGSSRSPIRSPPRGQKGGSVSVSPQARSGSPWSPSRRATASPPRRRVTGIPPQTSSRRSSLRSASCSPVRPSRQSLSKSSGKPSRRSPSRCPIRLPRISASSSGRAPPQRIPSPSPARAPSRSNRRSYIRSPVNSGRGVRTPVPDRGRSSSRSSVDGSPQRIRRGRGFSDRYTYARCYRSRSPDCSFVRSYRYGGRSDYGRYSRHRRSPRRYRRPPIGRTPLRYRGRRTCPIVSRSPIRYRSRSLIRSWSPIERNSGSPRVQRRRSASRSRSPSDSRSSHGSQSPKAGKER